MAQATTTTVGEIVLGGDLAGSADGNFPELRASGVTPGRYGFVPNATIDAKGRISWIADMTYENVKQHLATVTDTTKGLFKLGAGLTSSNGVVSLDATTLPASSSSVGFVKPTTGFAINGGVLSVAPAASNAPGLVQIGGNFSLSGGGAISVPKATTTTAGVFSITDVFSVAGSVVSFSGVSKSNTASVFLKAQNGTVQSYETSGTFSPNFQTGPAIVNLTLTGSLTISAPTQFAPPNCVVQMQIVLKNSPAGYPITLSGYTTNRPIIFSDSFAKGRSTTDVLTLICTSTECFAFLNNDFIL